MAISVLPVILLPTMDSERFERCTFSLQDRESLLTIYMTDLPPFLVHFAGLRWHRCTPQAECKPVLIQGCDMAVAEVHESPALKHYVQKNGVPAKDASALHHFRIYLGRGGCHEAFARSAFGSGHGRMARTFASIGNSMKMRFGRG